MSVRGRTGDDTETLAEYAIDPVSGDIHKGCAFGQRFHDENCTPVHVLTDADLAARDARVAGEAVAGVLTLADKWDAYRCRPTCWHQNAAASFRAVVAPHADTEAPCGASCPGDCGWNPNAADDPCAPPTDTEEKS